MLNKGLIQGTQQANHSAPSSTLMAQEPTSNPTPLAEIDHGPSKFEQFLEDNLKKIILAAVLLVVAVAGYIVVTGMESAKDNSAGEALQSASDIATYRDVIEKFPATPAAGSAALLIAEQQWKDGSQDEAIATLNSFIADNPEHPALANARLALASHFITQAKPEEAKPVLEKVASDPNAKHVAAFALLTLGDLEKQAGNEDAARAHYEKTLNDFPDNNPSTKSLANRRISLLGVAPPTKIAPPAPDPAPAPAPSTNTPAANTPLFPPIAPAAEPAAETEEAPAAASEVTEEAPSDDSEEAPATETEAPAEEGSPE